MLAKNAKTRRATAITAVRTTAATAVRTTTRRMALRTLARPG
jgi:hypothetical protein